MWDIDSPRNLVIFIGGALGNHLLGNVVDASTGQLSSVV